MNIPEEALVAYKSGELYYGHEEIGTEAWYREVMGESGIDLLITRFFYWVRRFPSAPVFTSGRGKWRILLHVPDEYLSTWMYEVENYEFREYYRGHTVTYQEAANQILKITEGESDAA